MDLHYLKIFYEVAKEKSFTKAAAKLYINQSEYIKLKNDNIQEYKIHMYAKFTEFRDYYPKLLDMII